MTTPLLDADQTQLDWRKADKRRQDQLAQQSVQDTITPAAGSLSTEPYYDRLNTIRADSQAFTAGSIAADVAKKQREAAAQAAEYARLQQSAMGSANAAMQAFQTGGSSADIWGAGGRQGAANALRAAGFDESLIPTMVAIAGAESGYRNDAVNDKNRNGSIDRGFMQINSIHAGNSWYPTDFNDPVQVAKAAKAIYDQQGLSAWSVYTSGAYKSFLAAAPPIQNFVANTGSNGLMSAQTDQAMAFSGVPTTTARAKALEISKQVLNIPYVWGGNSLKSGVDCSGLVQQVYAQMGISMPRQARAQATTGVRVSSYNQLRPGDLVAFKWAGGYAGPNVVSHIAIYIGNGQIIEAAGGSHGDIRSLGNSAQDRGAIYIQTRFPGE